MISSSAPAPARAYVTALLVMAALLWGWNYGLWDLEGPDEGRYVQVAKELSGRSDWLRLTVNGETYKEKPPLPFWMMAASMKLGGGEASAWTARLPSVLAGILAVLLVFDIGRALWGARAGFLAGVVLMTAPLFARQAVTARLDVLFTAWITLAAWAWLTAPAVQRTGRLAPARAALFWAALAGAFFTKGPLAIVAILGMLLAESWRSRSWAAWRSVRPLWGLSALLTLIGLWLFSQYRIGGSDFVRDQVQTGTLERILNGSHENPVWYYALTIFEDVFHPWLPFLIAALALLWREGKRAWPEGVRPLLGWTVVVLVLLHLSAGKRTQYLLPVLPPMALVTGWFLDTRVVDRALPRWAAWLVMGLGTALAGGYIAVAALAEEWPHLFWDHSLYLTDAHAVIAVLLALFAVGAVVLLYRRRDGWTLVLVLAALTVGGELFYAAIVNSARNIRRSSWSFARTVEGVLEPGERRVGALGRAKHPQFHVYGHYEVVPLDTRDDTFDWDGSVPRLLVARAEDSQYIRPALEQGGYRVLGTVQADDDQLTLLAAMPEGPQPGEAGPELPLRLAVAGDTGTDGGEQRGIVREMLARHEAYPLNAILLLGDNLYGDEPFPYAFRERFLEPFQPMLRRGIPFFAALGNHDGKEGGRKDGELHTPLLRMEGREYYTLEIGDGLITLIVLNSESIGKDEAQVRWFGQALRNASSTWTIVLLHRPVEASEISDGPDRDIRDLLRADLEAPWGPDLVLAGHNHLYERRHPVVGVHHITTGSGGKLDDDETFPADAGRAAGYNESRSFLLLDVHGDRIEGEAVSEDGEIVDRFTIEPRAEPPGLRLPLPPEEASISPS